MLEVMVHPDHVAGSAIAQADARTPGVRPQRFAFRKCRSRANSPHWAKCARPSIADLFVAVMGKTGNRQLQEGAS